LDFQLTPDVLIPRPETELLVDRAISWFKLHPSRRHAIDIGTGSGCIGISLAKNIPDLHLILTDISSQALEVARINAEKHGVSDRLEFRLADLMDGIRGPFDLICANLPYIPTPILLTLPALEKEPPVALDGGSTGTELIVRLLEQARQHLTSGGLLLLEIESSQGDDVKFLVQSSYPFSKVHLLQDLAGRDRCLELERSNQLVHICHRDEWLSAQQIGKYQDASLEHDGFIHCSQPEQVLDVANRYYRDVSDLILLWLDSEKLVSELRWESVAGIIYPHVFGFIDLDAVSAVSDLLPDSDGVFRNIKMPG
jgi:release factor glutamine methyltransferase